MAAEGRKQKLKNPCSFLSYSFSRDTLLLSCCLLISYFATRHTKIFVVSEDIAGSWLDEDSITDHLLHPQEYHDGGIEESYWGSYDFDESWEDEGVFDDWITENLHLFPHEDEKEDQNEIKMESSLPDGHHEKDENDPHHHHHSRQHHQPPYRHLSFLHHYISHCHALICIVLYVSLTWKVRRDDSAYGISVQSVLAMFVTEGISLSVRIHDIASHGFKHTRFHLFLVDFGSTSLAGLCFYTVWSRFDTSRSHHHLEDQYDTFGLNFFNFFFLIAQNIRALNFPCCPKAAHEDDDRLLGVDEYHDSRDRWATTSSGQATSGLKNLSSRKKKNLATMAWVKPDDSFDKGEVQVDWHTLKKYGLHLGQLRPTGFMGVIAQYSYWLFLYVGVAAPLALLFHFFRQLMAFSSVQKLSLWRTLDFFSFLIAYDDALRAVAFLPQLYMYELRKSKRISEQLLVFVVCEGTLKCVALFYWVTLPYVEHISVWGKVSRMYNLAVQSVNICIVVRFLLVLWSPFGSRGLPVEKTTEMTIPMNSPSPPRCASSRLETISASSTPTWANSPLQSTASWRAL